MPKPLLTKRQLRDFTEIMGGSEEMVRLLARLRNRTHMMNPWVRSLPGILRGQRLTRSHRVLDLPGDEGGISVPPVANYGIRVTGYDLLPDFVVRAKDLAAEERAVIRDLGRPSRSSGSVADDADPRSTFPRPER